MDDLCSFSELVKVCLDPGTTEEQFDSALSALRNSGEMNWYQQAVDLCNNNDPQTRELGVQILCQFSTETPLKHAKETEQLFLQMLNSEECPKVLAAIGWGLGHLKVYTNVADLRRLINHPDAEVRAGAVGALLYSESPQATAVLLELSRDDCAEVRNWATAGLGTILDTDNDDIRTALLERLSDHDEEVRLEAVYGLAKRGDRRVTGMVQDRLLSREFDLGDIRAARCLADASLIPALLNVRTSNAWEDDMVKEAVRICETGNA